MSEKVLEGLYTELGDKEVIDSEVMADCKVMVEEICKFIILFIAEYTWPFVTGQFLLISSYVVYWR